FLARRQTGIAGWRQRKRRGAILQMFEIDLHRLWLLGLFRFPSLACLIRFLCRIGFVFIGVLIAGVLLVLCVLIFVFVFIFIFIFVILCAGRLLVFALRSHGRNRVRPERQPVYAARHAKGVAAHVQPARGRSVIRAFREVEILPAAVKCGE